tara:strand:- start:3171 stop:4616 length:1446 start_codon:yes stop_codon:yes gene_type:complete
MKGAVLLDKHTYKIEDQMLFSRLSGDYNPMHINTSIARREKFGEIVVHGIFSLTKCLNSFVKYLALRGIKSIELNDISGKFPNPVFLNKETSNYLIKDTPENTVIGVFYGEMLLTELSFTYTEKEIHDEVELENNSLIEGKIQDLAIHEMKNLKGTYSLTLDINIFQKLFPNLISGIKKELMSTIFSLTRIVGMECPGRQSIFSSFKLEKKINKNQESGKLTYHTTRVVPKYYKIDISISTNKYVGKINAFYRPKPIRQKNIKEVETFINKESFFGQVALIIGGSRGLGEITSKIISAGGGTSIITYYQGKKDAESLCDEIDAWGGKCFKHYFDAESPKELFDFLDEKNIRPTHIYYFASGKIFQPRNRSFEMLQFQKFTDIYINCFFELYSKYRESWPNENLKVFYPSTVLAGAKTKYIEYSISKLSGEYLCQHLESQDPKLSINIERLPGILTDQNLGFNYQELESPLKIMFRVLKKMK